MQKEVLILLIGGGLSSTWKPAISRLAALRFVDTEESIKDVNSYRSKIIVIAATETCAIKYTLINMALNGINRRLKTRGFKFEEIRPFSAVIALAGKEKRRTMALYRFAERGRVFLDDDEQWLLKQDCYKWQNR